MSRIFIFVLLINACASRGTLSPEDFAALPKAVRESFDSFADADGTKRLNMSNSDGQPSGPVLDIDWRISGALVSIDFIEPLGSSVGSINFAEDSNSVTIDPNSRLSLIQRFGMDEQNYLTIDQHSLALKPSEIATLFMGKLPLRWRDLIVSVKREKTPNQSIFQLLIADADRTHDVKLLFDRKMRAEEFCTKTQWSRFFGLGSRSVVVCNNGNDLRNGKLIVPQVMQLKWIDVGE